MRLLVLLFMMVATLANAQKRILVTDKVDAKDSIRLRGKSIAEISVDPAFLSPTDYRIPTQKAVRDYVNSAVGNVDLDSLVKAASASGFLTANTIPYIDGNGRLNSRGYQALGAISAPGTPGAGVYVFADASNRFTWKSPDGYARGWNGTLTGDRVYTLQDASGTLAMLGVAQTWTGVQTFAPGGSGGAGFVYTSTTRPFHGAPNVTTAQKNAMTGLVAGDRVFDTTTGRENIWTGSAWVELPIMPSGGIGAGRIAYGDVNGNLTSGATFTWSGTTFGLSGGGFAGGFTIAHTGNNTHVITGGTGSENIAFGPSNRIFLNASQVQISYINNLSTINSANLAGSGGTALSIISAALVGASVTQNGISYNVNVTQSGTNPVANMLAITPTYNNTVASGATIRGIYYNPGITSLTNTTHNAWESTSGNVVIGSGIVTISGGTNSVYPLKVTNSTGTGSAVPLLDLHNNGGSRFAITYDQTSNTGATIYLRGVGGGYDISANGSGQLIQISRSITIPTGSKVGDSQNLAIRYMQFLIDNGTSEALTKFSNVIGNVGLLPGSVFRFHDATTTRGVYKLFQIGSNDGGAFTERFSISRLGSINMSYEGVDYSASTNTNTLLNLSGTINTVGGTNTIRGVHYHPILTSTTGSTHIAWESSAGDFIVNSGSMVIGASSINSALAFDVVNTGRATRPFTSGTDAQISSVTFPLAGHMFSTTKERTAVKRTDGLYYYAFTTDVKRDTSYKVVNANLDLSAETAHFKTRYYSVRIFTAVTAAAAGNNLVTMPVPSADLLGVQFRYYITDVSGDSDISQILFGTDGVDGYLSNGDGTYQSTFNLHAGFDVDVSIGWDENKSAYRWFLR